MPEITDEKLKELTDKAAEVETLRQKAGAADDFKKDMLKFKDELTQIKTEKTEAEKKGLVEKEQFKILYEKELAEKADAVKAKEEALGTVERYIKQGALETAALTAGLKKEALPDLKLLGFDSLQVRKDGAEIKVDGIETLLTEQKKLRPHWFGEAKGPNIIDVNGSGGAGGGGKELTVKELLELEKKDRPAYLAYRKKQITAAKKA